MLTEFGKYCRKLRIDRGELLKDMAEKLNVTSSYLSAIEVGKRKVPKNWVELISKQYNLDNEQTELLKKAAIHSQNEVKFDLNKYNANDKNLILAFARKFDELDEDFKSQIKKMLK